MLLVVRGRSVQLILKDIRYYCCSSVEGCFADLLVFEFQDYWKIVELEGFGGDGLHQLFKTLELAAD